MKFAPLELRAPATLEDALTQLSALGSDAQVLAGGQSLLPLLRYRVIQPHVLLDINGIAPLTRLVLQGEGAVRIGALVRHADLERAEALAPGLPLAALLAAHARQIAFHAVRNRGTVVGSILQADPKGDWPLLACALDARVELASARGVRSVAVREFILGPLLTARAVDELATALTLAPERARLSAWGRAKLMHRAGEYALCSAVALCREGAWDCWLGAIGERPMALPALADALAVAPAGAAPARAGLLAAAHADLASAAPGLGQAERHRNAVNAVDAALNAWNGLKR
jgi:CO/xanthine dehydrogenase FAD-binding subunit